MNSIATTEDYPDAYTEMPLTPLRRVIAARMTEAKQRIPHYRVAMDMELDALLSLRHRINDQLNKQGSKKHPSAEPTIPKNTNLSINDFVIKACAMALIEVPALNAQFVDNMIRQFHQADIAIVVAVEGGLSTPIIRSANTKSLTDIAGEVKTLADKAGRGQLKMAEISGGSFSISNLGRYGVDQFDAIINPPQTGILAVGVAKPKVVVKNDALTIATVMRANLSLDHRVVDGADGAKFLMALRRLLESPEALLDGQD